MKRKAGRTNAETLARPDHPNPSPFKRETSMTQKNDDTKSTHESMTDDRGRSTVTRRLAMNMIANSAIAGASIASLSAATFEADPIFAAIEVHKAANAAASRAIEWHSQLDLELPIEKCRSYITAWAETIVETDDPRWIECERAAHISYEAETDAAAALVNIKPTTLAGGIALLQYAAVADPDGHSWPDLMPDETAKLSRPWHHFLIANLAEILPGMVGAAVLVKV